MGLEHRLTGLDTYLFAQGNHYKIYNKMGAHLAEEDGQAGTYFTVWAPNARSVSVVGDFNSWDRSKSPMEMISTTGIWELFVPGVGEGWLYKFAIEDKNGNVVLKADPYGNASQRRPDNASVVANLNTYEWHDEEWQDNKKNHGYMVYKDKPMSIYEVHLGSWRKDYDEDPDGFYNYRRAAQELAEYVNDMGYTHIELMGIPEHPFDGSWGYQVTGYYAPTARYGSPQDFMYFVDYMHAHGIGVILDWVPAHFPKDEFGLARFDGTPLYEHADPRRGERRDWGTYCFNYAKNEVSNFLIANAAFWADKYHIDGLRVDAVASMLYLDYGRKDGEWVPNKYGGKEDLEAIEFIKHFNSIIHKDYPGVMTIAEESTAWPKVTGDVNDNGLGFTYKWNMGWMHDFLEYMQCDPYFRQYIQNEITFSFSYAQSERYILVLSHDEVVHLKKSMLYKMPGNMENKFGNLRVGYGLMTMHPGKKLLFMGQEWGQHEEWNENKALDWYLLDNYEEHRQLQRYYKALLHFYKTQPALYEQDEEDAGFEWINGGDAQHNMLTFCRMTKSGKNCLLCHFNFSPVQYDFFRSGVLCPGTYTEVFNDNAPEFGGDGMVNPEPIEAEKIGWDYKDYSIGYKLGGYGVVIFKFDYVKPVIIDAPAEEVPKKTRRTRKTAAKKTAKKTTTKKTTAKKTAAKKTAAEETAAEKTAAKKTAPKKTAAKKTAAEKKAETAKKAEAPKAETAKKAEAPKAETAKKAEAPKAETAKNAETAKKAEAPKAETAKKAEAPKAETAKKAEAPKAETAKKAEAETAKKAEAPKAETAKKAEAPKTETAPKAETAKKAEAPKAETAKKADAKKSTADDDK